MSTAEAADENNDLQPEVRLIAVVNGSDLTMPPTPTVNSPSPPVKPKVSSCMSLFLWQWPDHTSQPSRISLGVSLN